MTLIAELTSGWVVPEKLFTCSQWTAPSKQVPEPAGFSVDDSRFRRGAMDYLAAVRLTRHDSWDAFAAWLAAAGRRRSLYGAGAAAGAGPTTRIGRSA